MRRDTRIDQITARLEDERDTIKIQISLLNDQSTPTSTGGTLKQAQQRLVDVEAKIVARRRAVLDEASEG